MPRNNEKPLRAHPFTISPTTGRCVIVYEPTEPVRKNLFDIFIDENKLLGGDDKTVCTTQKAVVEKIIRMGIAAHAASQKKK